MRKLISVLLVACMIFGVGGILSGCGKDKDEKESGSKKQEVVDLGGYHFTINSPWLVNDTSGANLATYELVFQKRRREIEEQYNCTIEIVNVQNVGQKLLAGEKVADIINNTPYNLLNWAASGYLTPYEELEGIDINDSKWLKGWTDSCELDGKHYGLCSLKPGNIRNVLLYNKTMLEEKGITDNIAQLVKDNKWTFDKFEEILKQITDTEKKEYGLQFYDVYESFFAFIHANGGYVADVKDGKVVEGFLDSKSLTALNFLDTLVNTDKVVMLDEKQRAADTFATFSMSQAQIAQKFLNNKIGFYLCDAWVINQIIKPLEPEIEYGIVPMPMGPDADSYTSLSFGADAFAIPKANKDKDKAVILLNALAEAPEGYEGDEWVKDSIVYDYLQDGDDDSYEMYMMIRDNCMVYDFARTNCSEDIYGNFVEKCGLEPILFRKTSVSSALQSFEGVAKEKLGKLFNS